MTEPRDSSNPADTPQRGDMSVHGVRYHVADVTPVHRVLYRSSPVSRWCTSSRPRSPVCRWARCRCF